MIVIHSMLFILYICIWPFNVESGRVMPGYNVNFHHQGDGGAAGIDVIHEHEGQHETSHHEAVNNEHHERPEFQHHHYNNHPEVVDPNPTVPLQAIVPATPQILINPTPTTLNLSNSENNHQRVLVGPTPPPVNLSNSGIQHGEHNIRPTQQNITYPRMPGIHLPGHHVVEHVSTLEISSSLSSSQSLQSSSLTEGSSSALESSSVPLLEISSIRSIPERSSVAAYVSSSSDLSQLYSSSASSSQIEVLPSYTVTSNILAVHTSSETSTKTLARAFSSVERIVPGASGLHSSFSVSSSNCGILCLITRHPETQELSSSISYESYISTPSNREDSSSISPSTTEVGNLPSQAHGFIIHVEKASKPPLTTTTSTTEARITLLRRLITTTPLTLQTIPYQNTTTRQNSSATSAATEFPDILIPITERSRGTHSTSSTRNPEHQVRETQPNVTSTTRILTPMTELPEILIPITDRPSTRVSSTSNGAPTTHSTREASTLRSTQEQNSRRSSVNTTPSSTPSTTQMSIIDQYTLGTVTTKRPKYRSKQDYTFIFMGSTSSSVPSPTTTVSSTTRTTTETTSRPPHHNGSRQRSTRRSQSNQTSTTVRMGFIGSTTKVPVTTAVDLKSLTYPTMVPVTQSTVVKTEPTSTSEHPGNGSHMRRNSTRPSTSNPASNTTVTQTVGNTTFVHQTTSSPTTVQTPLTTITPTHNITTADVHIITPSEQTIPPVFVTVRLRMSWTTFCINVQSFQRELVRILEANYRDSFKEEQIMIMNDQIRLCVEPYQIEEEADIFVKLYIVDFAGEYDSSLTVECAQFIETGFHDESFFKDKLVRVTLNTADESKEELHYPTPPPVLATTSDPGVAIAITISTLGGFCCIGIIVLQLLMRRRYRKTRVLAGIANRRRFSIASNDAIALASVKARPNSGLYNPALDILDITKYINQNGVLSNPLDFAGLVNICQDVELIFEEFFAIKNDMPRLSAVPKGAEDKNRYSNVIPNPRTRVHLKRKISQVNSEYINANFITGYPDESKAFIATQAPLPNTREDFWRMIWEQQSRVIIMLTATDEQGTSKWCEYWPDTQDNIVKYGDFTVVLKKKDVTQEYIISTLELKDIENNLIREIKHVWYTSWTSRNLPDPVSLVKFVIDIRCLYEDSGGPLTVHCSPGTGRTGTLLAVDICTRQYDAEKMVDVLKCVSKMRKERAGVVQTKEQYALIYQALYEYALFVNSPPISAASSVMTLHQVRM